MTYVQLLILLLGLVACDSAEAPPPAGENEDGETTLDASKRDASSRDAARDARVIDARVEEPELPPEETEDDAGAPPVVLDAAVDAGAPSNATLPPVSDLAKPGPFTPTRGAGPAGYVLFHPQELGKDGVKHPIVTWGPGAAENAGSFVTLLNHFASHGFVVISYDGTPNGEELTKGIDWLVAENARSGSMFNGKLDTSKVASGGHSAGSLATFRIAKDARLTTTLHLCGGTFDPHTDIENLHAPALFICGESGGDGLLVGDVARPNCDIDFKNAKVPVFYGIPKGASHMSPTEIGDAALRSKFAAASVGWLRWQLAGDEAQKKVFVGADCTLCKDASWTAQQKNLN
ncbi:MAG: hypothetical protein ABW352_25720 [Polyangiales bacterium]